MPMDENHLMPIGSCKSSHLVDNRGSSIDHNRSNACLVGEFPGLIIDLAGQLSSGAED